MSEEDYINQVRDTIQIASKEYGVGMAIELAMRELRLRDSGASRETILKSLMTSVLLEANRIACKAVKKRLTNYISNK